jgi:Xaa-Pro aminopeptidase
MLKRLTRNITSSSLKKDLEFYSNFKNNVEIKNKLPNYLNDKNEKIFFEYFEALNRVRKEENENGNIQRVIQLDDQALKTITELRESGISSLKLQTFYQYLMSPLHE